MKKHSTIPAQPVPTTRATAGQSQMTRVFELCVCKARSNIKRLADQPKSGAFAVNGDYFTCKEEFFDIGNWTSSFFTGMALLAWRQTKDEYFIHQVNRLAPWYRKKVFERHMDTMHDLGFLYSLYSVALYKLTGDPDHRRVGLRAAELLAVRFDRKGGYIRAWGRMDDSESDYAGLAIIDCMMNLPLLYWASRETGDQRWSNVAIWHANTTLQYLIRADDSVFHSYRFDPKSGEVAGGDNYCGRSAESHWARGTAWAIYGFALSYREVGDRRYLDAALRLARRFLQNLDDEVVPIWDFKLPAGENPLRDSSAAAIAVCGLQELLKHEPGETVLATGKETVLSRICTEDYLDFSESCPGVLKNAEVGDGVGKARRAYTSWGDYFCMEALNTELQLGETFW